jgi:hypothetical protein
MNGSDPNRHAMPEGEMASWPRPQPRPGPAARTGDAEPRLSRPGGWLRFAHGSLSQEQLLRNLEQIVSVLQSAASGLEQIDGVLQELTVALSDQWSNRNRNAVPPEALRAYVSQRLRNLDDLARSCRFHGRGLLDGQSGVAGMGRGVVFIRGGPNTQASPPEGYEVRITELPSRASILGGVAVSEDWIWAEREIFLAEGDRFIRCSPIRREPLPEFLGRLQEQVRSSGLDLEVGITRQKRLLVRHTQYGSQFRFKGSSLTTPLLSKRPGKLEWSRKGKDVQGTLAGEPAFGIGRMLVGFLDNERTSELAVSWGGEPPPEGAGCRCVVVQNGIEFQDGDQPDSERLRISIPSFLPAHLGRWVDTRSGFGSLGELRVESWPQVLDGLYLLLAVQGEVIEWKDRVRSWIERYQNRALVSLRRSLPPAPARTPDGDRGSQAERMARLLREAVQQEKRAAE